MAEPTQASEEREPRSNPEITIDEIVDEFTEQLERGNRPSILEYAQKYPHLAERIENVLPALCALENVDTQPPTTRMAFDDSIPSQLGHYQIIQEVGRGGMGIVFEAIHTQMNRRVALKVLPKSLAKRNYVPRFLTEAQSAGQLHHTNIVPVFEVDQADGLHYYSMQFIHGENLCEVIKDVRRLKGLVDVSEHSTPSEMGPSDSLSQTVAFELLNGSNRLESKHHSADDVEVSNNKPTKPVVAKLNDSNKLGLGDSVFNRSMSSQIRGTHKSRYHQRVATVGLQVANALEYAHRNGVLHRDVKPANLILDVSGNVWVTDFGLAKLDTNDLTKTGDVLGTIQYMAPERYDGHADARSDLYSLGLTLYELATLESALSSGPINLRNSKSSHPPIQRPRSLNPDIPIDLETIILKSIHFEPKFRYQSCQALADDLQCFLNDQPIKARRESWGEKLGRIARQNPLATLLAACLVMLLIIIAAGSIQVARNEIRNSRQSRTNLYYSKLDQVQLRRLSKQTGQRFKTLSAIQEAVDLLPTIGLSPRQIRDDKSLLRSEAVAALAMTDMDLIWHLKAKPGWGNNDRFVVSDCGRRYAIGHDDGRIQIRSVENHDVELEIPPLGENMPAWGIDFSSQGKYFSANCHPANASRNRMVFQLWRLSSNPTKILELKGIVDIDYSPDDRYLAANFLDRVEVHDLENLQKSPVVIYPDFITQEDERPHRVRFGKDNSTIAISESAGGTIEFWKLDTSQPTLDRSLELDAVIYQFDWDEARELLVVGSSDGALYYWHGDLDQPAQSLRLHQNTIYRVELHPTRALVGTSAWDWSTRLTDLIAGQELLRVKGKGITRSGFCGNGDLNLSAGDAGHSIWQVATPLVEVYQDQPIGICCRFHPIHPHLVFRSTAETVEVWNQKTRGLALVLDRENVHDMHFSADGRFLFVGGNDGLQQFRIEIGQPGTESESIILVPLKSWIDQRVKHIAISSDQQWLLAGVGDDVFRINLGSDKIDRGFARHGSLSGIEISCDDQYFVTGTWHGYGAKIWDLETGEIIQTLNEFGESLFVKPHPENPDRIFVGYNELQSFQREPETGRFEKLKDSISPIHGKIYLSDNDQLVGARHQSSQLLVLNQEMDQVIFKLTTAGEGRIVDVEFSQNGQQLALSCFDNLQVFELQKIRDKLVELNLDW